MNLEQLKSKSLRMWDYEEDYEIEYFNDFIEFWGIIFDIKLTFYTHNINVNFIRMLTHIRILAYWNMFLVSSWECHMFNKQTCFSLSLSLASTCACTRTLSPSPSPSPLALSLCSSVFLRKQLVFILIILLPFHSKGCQSTHLVMHLTLFSQHNDYVMTG